MQQYAIIVAGGSGTRMKHNIPKQFMELGDKPILMHTLEAYILAISEIQLILVLPENQISFWKSLCDQFNFHPPHLIQPGGKTRFHSVKNGLERVDDDGLVAIHDGVRPLVSADVIRKSFEIAATKGNAIAAVGLKDSIRRLTSGGNERLDRSVYQLIQTPQTFQTHLIKKAYETAYDPSFTDDASVVEKIGEKINLFQGEYSNLKITTPEDIAVAEALLSYRHK